jgi:UPF0755 protein
MSRLLKILVIAVAVVALTTGAAGAWVFHKITTGANGPEVTLTIPVGASTQQIAALLDDKKVISSAQLFRLYVKAKGAGAFQAGEYRFPRDISISSVVGILKKGPSVKFDRLTIPEGFTLKEIAERVGQLPGRAADRFMAAAQSGAVHSAFQPAGSNNLEGLLFPDTYYLDPKDDEATILRRMVELFDKQAREAGVATYNQLIVASLVESEGKVAADRPKIAQVIYNRLAKGIKLQIDATVIYARGGVHRENGQVLFSDLKVESPYNTYLHEGLPPTPIASPGRAAMKAAVAPQEGPWLYYVKFQADGTHAFAVTLDEQNRNIADARRRGVNP